ncbi:hypothetical protein CEXT_185071 [Caerostris extrusa]|uniref:Uncharacterized protein n=1 Tax=Caerostris extrusa TaxID=172846 RepID=A0AAV4RXT6_CAEEX|nr:hypothetical protein CEXT_185071 [Caerostris extrusa]
MDTSNCEFCNAYVADFEVHTCRIFGNQHRQSFATLPRSSSGNIAEGIGLRTEQIHYEERVPSMNQTNSSWQHIILPNVHQRTDCEDTAAAVVSSQYGIANQNPYNLEISDCLCPQTESAYSLQPSDDNSTIGNQNFQYCEAWYPNPLSTLPCLLLNHVFCLGFNRHLAIEIH